MKLMLNNLLILKITKILIHYQTLLLCQEWQRNNLLNKILVVLEILEIHNNKNKKMISQTFLISVQGEINNNKNKTMILQILGISDHSNLNNNSSNKMLLGMLGGSSNKQINHNSSSKILNNKILICLTCDWLTDIYIL